MNREKVRTRSRKVPSPLLSVVIFASLGVVAVPVPPAHRIRRRSPQIHSNQSRIRFRNLRSSYFYQVFPRARREAQPRLLFCGEVGGSSPNPNQILNVFPVLPRVAEGNHARVPNRSPERNQHRQFFFPGNILGGANFGQLTQMTTGYTPRQIQFALRLQF